MVIVMAVEHTKPGGKSIALFTMLSRQQLPVFIVSLDCTVWKHFQQAGSVRLQVHLLRMVLIQGTTPGSNPVREPKTNTNYINSLVAEKQQRAGRDKDLEDC